MRRPGSLTALLVAVASALTASAGAQAPSSSPPCDAATFAVLAFSGLPGAVVSGRVVAFGVDDTFASDSTAPGAVAVRMVDRGGRTFFRAATEPGDRGDDLLGVRLDLGDRLIRVLAQYEEVSPDGRACSRTLTRTVREQRRVYFPTRCLDPTALRPRSIVVACGDGNFRLRRMRWRGWNRGVARGRGIGVANDCVPYCAAGHFHSHPVRVRLTRPRRCASADRYAYTRLEYRLRGAPGWTSVPFPCRLYED